MFQHGCTYLRMKICEELKMLDMVGYVKHCEDCSCETENMCINYNCICLNCECYLPYEQRKSRKANN